MFSDKTTMHEDKFYNGTLQIVTMHFHLVFFKTYYFKNTKISET